MNAKARLAARTIFDLVHRYGDVLREGWRPLFDCIFQLFRCKLLPKILVEVEFNTYLFYFNFNFFIFFGIWLLSFASLRLI